MNNYVVFNIVFGAIVAASMPFLIRSSAQLRIALLTAAYVTVFAFPWDHFAITHGAWTYPNPGPRLFDVPVNDIIFIFVGSLFSAAILDSRGRIGAEPQSQSEDGGDKAPGNEVH